MAKRALLVSAIVMGSLLLSGCDSMYRTDSHGHKHLTNTAAGAGIGAVGGAVIGGMTGGTTGAIIGTGVGAVGGGVVGNQMDK